MHDHDLDTDLVAELVLNDDARARTNSIRIRHTARLSARVLDRRVRWCSPSFLGLRTELRLLRGYLGRRNDDVDSTGGDVVDETGDEEVGRGDRRLDDVDVTPDGPDRVVDRLAVELAEWDLEVLRKKLRERRGQSSRSRCGGV